MKKHDENFGFIIIAPDHNNGLLQSTLVSIKRAYPYKIDTICMVDDKANKKEIVEMSRTCPVYKGGTTIMSLINNGLKKEIANWNIIVFAGSQVMRSLTHKIFYFMENEKDILFPIIVDQNYRGRPIKVYTNFTNATLNGLTMHKNAIKEIGTFSDNPIEISKLFWGLDAIDLGYKFKSLLGAKII